MVTKNFHGQFRKMGTLLLLVLRTVLFSFGPEFSIICNFGRHLYRNNGGCQVRQEIGVRKRGDSIYLLERTSELKEAQWSFCTFSVCFANVPS